MLTGPYLLTTEEIGSFNPDCPMTAVLDELVSGLLGLRDAAASFIDGTRAHADGRRRDWDLFRTKPPMQATEPGRQKAKYDAPPVRQPIFASHYYAGLRSSSVADAMPRMLLLEAVAQYDKFVGNLLRAMLKLDARKLGHITRTAPASDLLRCTSNAEIRGLLIELEVDELSHKTRAAQIDYFAEKFKLETVRDFAKIPMYAEFAEIIERRNLFAHNGGRVSTQYLKASRADRNLHPGDFLSADAAYVRRACEVLVVVATLLTQMIWRGSVPAGQSRDADAHLGHLTYSLLATGEFHLAEQLLSYAHAIRRHIPELSRLLFTINFSQAFKWQNKEEKCREILACEEWNSRPGPFQLAHAVLTDNFAAARELMLELGCNGEVTRDAFDHWPLFKSFRETAEYTTSYELIYGAKPAGRPIQLDLRDMIVDLVQRAPSEAPAGL